MLRGLGVGIPGDSEKLDATAEQRCLQDTERLRGGRFNRGQNLSRSGGSEMGLLG